jgi:competence ComEA-like helix-hairpin-helix protein
MKIAAGLFVTILSGSLTPAIRAQDLPAGEGRDILELLCTTCHSVDSIPRLRYTRAGWTKLVFSMRDKGLEASTDELYQIADYLTKNFGKAEDAVKKTNVNSASAKEIESALGFTSKEAEAIVLYRIKNGNYKDLDAMKKVEGIDAAKIQSVKEKIEF